MSSPGARDEPASHHGASGSVVASPKAAGAPERSELHALRMDGMADDETALLRRYAETRDPALKEELVLRFLPLARSLALRYRSASEPLDDLIQVASLGLIKALDGFDLERGRSFIAYAAPTILGELRRHFRDRVWEVRLPRGLQERTMAVAEAAGNLADELGRSPTVTQIAGRLGLEPDEVSEALQADEARRTLSLDLPRARDEPPAGVTKSQLSTRSSALIAPSRRSASGSWSPTGRSRPPRSQARS